MSEKKKFGSKFMDLWITDDSKPEEKQKQPTTSFPSSSAGPAIKFPDAEVVEAPKPVPMVGSTHCGPQMDAVMKLYEDGFESLNQPGIEFFEYFKSVVGGGVNIPGSYKMALNMLNGMGAGLTKDKLINQSQFYLTEIDKVHQSYSAKGIAKKAATEAERNNESEQLNADIALLRQQVEGLQNQIQTKSLELSGIDSRYNPILEEIGCKLEANNSARDTIAASIKKVVEGINANL